jgi:hypothetical protein
MRYQAGLEGEQRTTNFMGSGARFPRRVELRVHGEGVSWRYTWSTGQRVRIQSSGAEDRLHGLAKVNMLCIREPRSFDSSRRTGIMGARLISHVSISDSRGRQLWKADVISDQADPCVARLPHHTADPAHILIVVDHVYMHTGRKAWTLYPQDYPPIASLPLAPMRLVR